MKLEANILVADDEAGLRDVIEFELGDRGHRVSLAANGLEAIAALQEHEFDLVITDIRMPGADGLAVLDAAKSAFSATEVIVMSGYADVDAAVECIRRGASDLIRKPFHLGDFLNAVDRALEHRRLRLETRLYAACSELLGVVGTEPLAERIAQTATTLLDADDATVMVTDGSGSLRIAHSTGIPHAVQSETRLALGERIAGRVALDRSPAILPGALDDDPRFRGLPSFGRVSSAIIYPLVHRDVMLGVLTINRSDSGRPFRRADLETAGIVAAQAALALSNEDLGQRLVTSERMAAVGQLASGIVHEIKNPMTYVAANAEYVRATLAGLPEDARGGRVLPPEVADDIDGALDEMADGLTRLDDIVTDVRGLSRSAGTCDEHFDVNDAIHSAVRIARPSVSSSTILVTDLGEPDPVLGNAGRLSQVVLNLVVNAAQAIESGAGHGGRIVVRSRREDDHVVVSISDDGPGIAPDVLHRITEPFFTTKANDGGSGLGLSISQRIVEEHHGELTVSSELGEGTTFTVRLPRRGPARGASTTPRASLAGSDEGERLYRVLVVDDEPSIRRAFRRILERTFSVEVESDGASALSLLERDAGFDAIVSDVTMPGLDGTELYRQVKARWPGLAARMLLVTGTLDRGEQYAQVHADGVPVLQKPVDAKTLREAILGSARRAA